ncbi:MAG: hypothetical protein O2855_09295 [Planctomycetota bacterium]|nr:hypothetical protein [Planctomycetota bacterium]
MPIWFVGGVMFVFAPELGRAMGVPTPVEPAKVILWAYSGVVVGDLASGLLSQVLQSRVRAIITFQAALAASIALFFSFAGESAERFYWMMAVVGAATGYWAVFVTTASEQFGTNLRATAATSAPNFVRASAVIVTGIWFAMKDSMNTTIATMALGVTCVAIGVVATIFLTDTFSRDLDFVEK